LDSTTVAAFAQKQDYELVAVTVQYGQKHSREIESATMVARSLGIKHEVVDVGFFKRLAWYSALTSSEQFSVPKLRNQGDMAADIPITYVPLRNTFFVTLAAAFAESEALYLIEQKKIEPEAVTATRIAGRNTMLRWPKRFAWAANWVLNTIGQ
jgi:7-cyano-7-deazaguanine synthase